MSTVPKDFDPKKLGWRFLLHLPQFMRLFWRLFKDPRVSIWAKSILVFAAAYVISPVDLIPDILFLVGRVDDLTLAVLACRTFLSLCPPDVVEEHVKSISRGR